jgi:5-methylcytosine-specific restriction enzyme subunit McrC
MHALCRFFLENSGPIHDPGNKTFLPFTVNMARLFERFVAEWMKKHLPPNLKLKYQEHIDLGSNVKFEIDMVIYNSNTDEPAFVLDTKYKAPESPSSADISQIVAYAEAKDCKKALLIYPSPIAKPVDTYVGNHHVQTVFFELGSDLEAAGVELLLRLGLSN